jgi:hypothetical protein
MIGQLFVPVKLDFFTIHKDSLNFKVIVQEQQVSIASGVQCTLAIRNPKNLSRVKGSSLNSLDDSTLCEITEIAHALIDCNGAIK